MLVKLIVTEYHRLCSKSNTIMMGLTTQIREKKCSSGFQRKEITDTSYKMI